MTTRQPLDAAAIRARHRAVPTGAQGGPPHPDRPNVSAPAERVRAGSGPAEADRG